MVNQPVASIPKYNRLTKKQSIFLHNLFESGQVFEHALSDLSISYRMLYSWLQQPRFLHAIEVRMAQFHLQTRLQSARSACHAVQSLSDLCSRSVNHGVVRQASMDLLKIHHAFDTQKYSRQVAQKCAPDSHRCAPAAQKSASLRASGTKMSGPERPQISKITDLCSLNPADTPKIRLVR